MSPHYSTVSSAFPLPPLPTSTLLPYTTLFRSPFVHGDGILSISYTTSPQYAVSFGNSENSCKIDQVSSPNGGIGRRVALKMQYRKMCGFESHFGYKSSRTRPASILRDVAG